ncbi:COMM domain-containing protein 4 isoform X2 [Parus major]|uniref:COMM domain-containing protein 4 isoform X2 n=1 Tax=Parus major TaxID=9157 RepID=UPI0014442530|nr:COMM domain-containing protein 4 isoform X2 [Parus major]
MLLTVLTQMKAGRLLCCPPSPPFCAFGPWGLLRCFGGVWQLQVCCEQRGSSLVSPDEQSTPAACAVPTRRSRAPSRTGSGRAACDVSAVSGPSRGVGVGVSPRAAVSRGTDTIPLPALVSQLGSVRWRVDYTLSSSELQEVNEPVVHLTFNVRDTECDKITAVPVTLSANKFWVLLGELKQAQTLMNTLF